MIVIGLLLALPPAVAVIVVVINKGTLFVLLLFFFVYFCFDLFEFIGCVMQNGILWSIVVVVAEVFLF